MNSKTKILIGGMLPPPNFGHSMIYALLMSTEFSRTFDVTFLNFRFWSYSSHRRITLKKLAQFLYYFFYYIYLIGRRRPDYILYGISFDRMPFLKDGIFLMTGGILGCKIVLHDQGQYLEELYSGSTRLTRGYIRLVFRHVAAAIVLAKTAKKTYKGLLAAERVFVVPAAVCDTKGPVENTIQDKSYDTENVTILFFSFITAAKGVWTALEASRLTLERDTNCRFIFAGPFQSPEVEKEIIEFVDKHNLGNKVEFTGYIADEQSRTELFRASDIFIFPTHRDVFGLVLLHAMAEGLPVIASEEGSIPEILAEGEAGVLIPKQNSIILAQEILRLISDFELRIQLGNKSRKRYESMYTPRDYSERIISAFNQIIQLDGHS